MGMESLAKVLTIEEVAEQMLRCKLDVYRQINDINQQLADGTMRMDEIENILEKHEKQRQSNYDETKEALHLIRGELQSYRNDFNNHDIMFHSKIGEVSKILHEITEKLTHTAKETDANTMALHKQRRQADIDKAVEEALEAEHKPYKELKMNAIKVVVGAISLAILGGLWKLILFVSDLHTIIDGAK